MDGLEVDLEVKDEVECASSAEVDLEISDGMLLTAVGLMNNGAKRSIADGWMACASIDLMTRWHMLLRRTLRSSTEAS